METHSSNTLADAKLSARLHDALARFEPARFEPVAPHAIAARDLLRRSVTKYVLPLCMLDRVLLALAKDYGLRPGIATLWAHYVTHYYDSPNFELFCDHRRGKRIRYKIRVRHYLDRKLSFTEIKKRIKPAFTEGLMPYDFF